MHRLIYVGISRNDQIFLAPPGRKSCICACGARNLKSFCRTFIKLLHLVCV